MLARALILVEDVPMRMLLGLGLIVAGVVALLSAGVGGDWGDRHLWLVVVGGSAVFFGIGMLIRGAMRMAIFALGGLLLVFGLGMGLFDLFS